MKYSVLILLMAASTAAASAQTPVKPASTATTAAKPATAATAVAKPAVKSATTAQKSTAASTGIKLPPGVPPVKGVRKTAFSLRYQEIKIGSGAVAEPNKLYKVHYTGWLGVNGRDDDGHKFDSSYDHPGQPLKDKDGKPVLGEDGKPKLGDPLPFQFPQGIGRLIPGFDQGFEGMRIGGKRRLFIPWQLAYGAKGHPGPDAAHPGIPPKADLIFDVELIDVTDLPTPPSRPAMPPHNGPNGRAVPPNVQPRPATGASPSGTASQPGVPAPQPAPAVPSAPPAPATTAQPK
jgi:peptidylprolyl isomerase